MNAFVSWMNSVIMKLTFTSCILLIFFQEDIVTDQLKGDSSETCINLLIFDKEKKQSIISLFVSAATFNYALL